MGLIKPLALFGPTLGITVCELQLLEAATCRQIPEALPSDDDRGPVEATDGQKGSHLRP
jgi:hypothetical protein